MTSFRVTLALAFMIVFTMIACSSEEETPTAPGGTPPEGTNSSNVCSEGLCASPDYAALKAECEEFLNNCLAANPEGREDECVGGAWMICNGDI